MEVSLLNKFEKRDLVIRLHEERRTYSEIAHIAHVSIRDTKPIIKKYEKSTLKSGKDKNKKRTLSQGSQAFKLFKEGKSALDVAIILDLNFPKIDRLWREYLFLSSNAEFFYIYEDNKPRLNYLLKINRFLKENNIPYKNISEILETANSINNLRSSYSNLKDIVEKSQQTKNNFQNINDRCIIERIPNPGPCPYGPPITWRFRTNTNNPF